MPTSNKRLSFEAGHRRKYLLIVDESKEVEAALYFCASRISHSSGAIVMLYCIEPQDYQHWAGVRQVQVEEETNKAKALFRLFRRKLTQAELSHVEVEEVIREGKTADEILALIESDPDIAILVLGAAVDSKGPGPLVSRIATGGYAGNFPIPITIVPGNLTLQDVTALA